MSAETSAWLNNNVLIGFTDKRGKAWHNSERSKGSEDNHYTGAIPVDDVKRRLFSWEPIAVPLSVNVPAIVSASGVSEAFTVTDDTRQAIIRPDTQEIMGLFKAGYKVHGFSEWLIHNVENILDADLAIGSAGLLRRGAVAWVQVEMAETIDTPEGESFRPFITATTSLDGTIATTYQDGVTRVVCDNTLAVHRAESTARKFKVKHTKNSLTRINDAREALNIVHTLADDFAAEVKTLCEWTVSDTEWAAFLDAETKAASESKRAVTMAENYRDALGTLWNRDPRVEPWKGTAWGVVQARNTYAQHWAISRGASLPERNAERMVKGEDIDTPTLALLSKVTGRPLVTV